MADLQLTIRTENLDKVLEALARLSGPQARQAYANAINDTAFKVRGEMQKELRSRFPAANNALSELMALDFAIDELGLYLVTHADDQEVLNLYWKYIALAREGRARYQEQYGPLTQTTVTEGGYRWLNDPWPWDEGGSD